MVPRLGLEHHHRRLGAAVSFSASKEGRYVYKMPFAPSASKEGR